MKERRIYTQATHSQFSSIEQALSIPPPSPHSPPCHAVYTSALLVVTDNTLLPAFNLHCNDKKVGHLTKAQVAGAVNAKMF